MLTATPNILERFLPGVGVGVRVGVIVGALVAVGRIFVGVGGGFVAVGVDRGLKRMYLSADA